MKFRPLVLILALFISITVCGQGITKDKSPGDSISGSNLSDSVEVLKNELEFIRTEIAHLKEESKKIEQKVQSSNQRKTEILDFQSSLLSNFGLSFSILFGLTTLLALGLPVLFYFIGYKPSVEAAAEAKKLMKEVEYDLNDRFDTFQKQRKKKELKKYLKVVEEGDVEERRNAASYIRMNYSGREIKDSQFQFIFKILLLLESDNYETIILLSSILSKRKNVYCHKYFKKFAGVVALPHFSSRMSEASLEKIMIIVTAYYSHNDALDEFEEFLLAINERFSSVQDDEVNSKINGFFFVIFECVINKVSSLLFFDKILNTEWLYQHSWGRRTSAIGTLTHFAGNACDKKPDGEEKKQFKEVLKNSFLMKEARSKGMSTYAKF